MLPLKHTYYHQIKVAITAYYFSSKKNGISVTANTVFLLYTQDNFIQAFLYSLPVIPYLHYLH